MTSTAVATDHIKPVAVRAPKFSLSPQNYEQALHFSETIAASDFAPKDYRGKPANCFIAMQWGSVLGLDPMASIQGISVINGRPALWGDAMLAIVLASPVCDYVREENDGVTAVCRVRRKGGQEQVRTFSMEDARVAGLLGKPGPWQQYPKRMLQMRARGFALRDVFTDVLRGLDSAEEINDRMEEEGYTETVEAQPQMVVATQAVPVQAQLAVSNYPQESFEMNIDAWAQRIRSGRYTPESLIVHLEGKGVRLSKEQKERLIAVSADSAGDGVDAVSDVGNEQAD